MKYFFNNKNEIIKNLTSRRALIFLDYDGTLVPIKKNPELAVLNLKIKKLLRQISKKHFVAIISGRTLAEIKKLVGIENIIYSGNHGFEIEMQMTADKKTRFPQIFICPAAKRIKPEIQTIKKALQKRIENIKGAWVEDKGLTITIHWRQVNKRYLPELFATIRAVIRNNSRVVLTKGKKVWEIRPNVKWNKGKAVRFIMSKVRSPKSKVVPVFIGDDTTDEDAFKTLNNGITIRVGQSKKSKAKYYIKNQSEIKKTLSYLIA